MEGKYATLLIPYKGYRNILLICREGIKWTAEICGSGKIIELFDDEFVLDS